jgi:DNA-binding Lrp family transcriptional regulator
MVIIWQKTTGVFIIPWEKFKMLILDDLDRKILDLLQNDFPLAVQPFFVMAEGLSISEDELMSRIAVMKESGLIRRIGGIMDSRNLGYYSTLCAVSVPEIHIEEAAQIINRQSGVTHNYLRDHEYNIWFTLTMSSQEEAMIVLRELETSLGLNIISMPAEKVYKIKVSFNMGSNNDQ